MKKSLIVLFALSLVIFACDKEIEYPTEASDIQISVTKNDVDHNPKISYFLKIENELVNDGDSNEYRITLYWSNKPGIVNEVLSLGTFKGILDKQKPNIYSIIPNNNISPYQGAVYNTLLFDGDVLGSTYSVDTTAVDNFIQITNYDSKRNRVNGIFNLRMKIIERSSAEPDIPEILDFTNGKFSARVPPDWFRDLK